MFTYLRWTNASTRKRGSFETRFLNIGWCFYTKREVFPDSACTAEKLQVVLQLSSGVSLKPAPFVFSVAAEVFAFSECVVCSVTLV